MKKLCTVVVLALMLVGCADPYGSCVNTANVIATSVGTAMNDLPVLVQDGLIDKTEASNVLNYLNAANGLDAQFESCVSLVHSSKGKVSGYLVCSATFANGLKSPQELVLLGVKNPRAQLKVRAYVDALQLALAILAANLSGQPVVQPTPVAQTQFIYDPWIIAMHPVWVNPVGCSTTMFTTCTIETK